MAATKFKFWSEFHIMSDKFFPSKEITFPDILFAGYFDSFRALWIEWVRISFKKLLLLHQFYNSIASFVGENRASCKMKMHEWQSKHSQWVKITIITVMASRRNRKSRSIKFIMYYWIICTSRVPTQNDITKIWRIAAKATKSDNWPGWKECIYTKWACDSRLAHPIKYLSHFFFIREEKILFIQSGQ